GGLERLVFLRVRPGRADRRPVLGEVSEVDRLGAVGVGDRARDIAGAMQYLSQGRAEAAVTWVVPRHLVPRRRARIAVVARRATRAPRRGAAVREAPPPRTTAGPRRSGRGCCQVGQQVRGVRRAEARGRVPAVGGVVAGDARGALVVADGPVVEVGGLAGRAGRGGL